MKSISQEFRAEEQGGGGEDGSMDEKLIIWWRRHGSLGSEKDVQGADGTPVFITSSIGSTERETHGRTVFISSG